MRETRNIKCIIHCFIMAFDSSARFLFALYYNSSECSKFAGMEVHSNLRQGGMDEQQIKPYFLRGRLGFSGDRHHVTLGLRQSPHNPGSQLVNQSMVPSVTFRLVRQTKPQGETQEAQLWIIIWAKMISWIRWTWVIIWQLISQGINYINI